MSTNVYADFISEQQAKLRGAGMLDEETSETITANIPDQSPKSRNFRTGSGALMPTRIPHIDRDHEAFIALGEKYKKHGIKHSHGPGTGESGFNKIYQPYPDSGSAFITHKFDIPKGTDPEVIKRLKGEVDKIASTYTQPTRRDSKS